MQHEMTIYVLPAVLALLIKLVVLFNSRSGTGRSTVFFTMVLIFAAHNSAELLGFLEYFKGAHLTNVLRWYYVMTVCVLAVMLLYAREVSTADRQNKYFNLGVAVVTVVVGSLILFTDLMIAGSTSLGFIMTAVKGPHYWIFSATVLLSFSAVTCYLVSGYRNAQDHLTEIQCSYTLLALAPVMLVGITLVVLMGFGIKVSGAAILPVTTTLFLLITLKGEPKHGLTDIRRHIPLSLERRKSGQIMDIFSSYAKDELSYRDSLTEIEKLLVTYKHDKNNGNVSTTASTMNIPRSSLYSIFRRLDIVHKDSK